MAKKAGRVIGAEIVPPAIRDAEENAKRNAVTNAEFFCGDAVDIAAKLESDGLRPDVTRELIDKQCAQKNDDDTYEVHRNANPAALTEECAGE